MSTILQNHAARLKELSINQLFFNNPDRFTHFSYNHDALLCDLSKTHCDNKLADALCDHAKICAFFERRDALFSGLPLNNTEKRPVLHTALRNQAGSEIFLDGHNIQQDIETEKQRFLDFAEKIRSGTIKSITGKIYKNIVHLGIGGSDLGPKMVVQALHGFCDGPKIHFVSNIDPYALDDVLHGLDPSTTLILIASKTLTTLETMANANIAHQWLNNALGKKAAAYQSVALTASPDKALEIGLLEAQIFRFWDFVGGRYSSWSAIGLPIAIAIGKEHFLNFLDGARSMDQHFLKTPLKQNIPAMLGMISFFYHRYMDCPELAVIPYAHSLQYFPDYLQQLSMESNGKSVGYNRQKIQDSTGAVLFGGAGTDAQHSFFQLLHQGSHAVLVEFIIQIGAIKNERQAMLVANALAQSRALMLGKSEEDVIRDLTQQGYSQADSEALAPHKIFPGNRPSITLMLDQITPYNLGSLMALYEHRVFTEGCLFGVNSFDQWGVELGKEMAAALLPMIQDGDGTIDKATNLLDSSTHGLIHHLQQVRNNRYGQ